jgi:putative nucleotidyltransferase with HDIG domain
VGGHAAQVAAYAVAIAHEMELPADRVKMIRQSAYLHDIGKIAIPESILHKPSKLSDAEYEFLKKHAEIGADFIATGHGLCHLVPFIRHHHERWDGRGYPLGLAGEAIPLEARILNVCDSVEAMASDRPYHRAFTADQIIAELQRCAGSQFDPAAVDAFTRVVEREGAHFVVNSARTVAAQRAEDDSAADRLTMELFGHVYGMLTT